MNGLIQKQSSLSSTCLSIVILKRARIYEQLRFRVLLFQVLSVKCLVVWICFRWFRPVFIRPPHFRKLDLSTEREGGESLLVFPLTTGADASRICFLKSLRCFSFPFRNCFVYSVSSSRYVRNGSPPSSNHLSREQLATRMRYFWAGRSTCSYLSMCGHMPCVLPSLFQHEVHGTTS